VLEVIKKAIAEAKKVRHRRIIVLSNVKNLADVLDLVKSSVVDKFGSLYVTWEPNPKIEKILGEFEWIKPNETDKILGTTWDLLVAEEPQDLSPNALGRVVETVRGGGILFFITKSIEDWGKRVADYHKRIVSPPYTLDDVKRRFTFRLKRKMFEHKGIVIIHNDRVIYEALEDKKVSDEFRPSITNGVEALVRSRDQLRVLRAIRSLGEERGRAALVIRADRGRGKSVALGLGMATLISEGLVKGDLLLTAPSPLGISQIFEFLERGLKAKDVRYEREGFELRANKVRVKFVSPYVLSHKKGAIAIVDEAAGIPLPLLLRYPYFFDKLIYSSTVHGYEGSGRGFGLRFRKRLREFEKLKIMEIEMTEPIRYAKDDPIEKWLYDVLLLDSEPDEIRPEEVKVVDYQKVDRDYYFGRGENRLRAFIGTYVTAHYRNRPDDLVLLGDAPHHFARTLTLPDGRIVVAMHLAREGSLTREEVEKISEGEQPPGHLIPGVLLKHHPVYKNFGMLKGVRIVRIATNPSLFNRGLGSLALKCLEEEMEGKVDWLGASFGASKELVNFWLKNGYVPVHISPMRNAASGEYSVIFVKPLTSKAKSYIESINMDFRNRLFNSLHDTYYGLLIDTALMLFKGFETKRIERAKLTESQKARLKGYVRGDLSYESVSDVIKELVRAHLFTGVNKRVGIPEKVEKALCAKCLQGRSWEKVREILGTRDPHPTFRRFVEKMREYYVG